MRVLYRAVLLAGCLAACGSHAQADEITVTATNFGLGTLPIAPNADSLTVLDYTSMFVRTNQTFMLQPGFFQEGLNSPPGASVGMPPYLPGSGSFYFLDTVVLKDYSDSYRLLNTVSAYVALNGTVIADSSGNRIIVGENEFYNLDKGIVLEILPFVPLVGPDSASPIDFNAILMDYNLPPQKGNPAPTPEPSSLVLAGTGLLAGMVALRRRMA